MKFLLFATQKSTLFQSRTFAVSVSFVIKKKTEIDEIYWHVKTDFDDENRSSLYSLKKQLFLLNSWIKFNESHDASEETIIKIYKTSKCFPLNAETKRSQKNILQLHIKLKEFRWKRTQLHRFIISTADFVQNSKVWSFFCKTVQESSTKLERFRSEGLVNVYKGRTFVGFVQLFIVSFDTWNHFEAFGIHRNLSRDQENPFSECTKLSIISILIVKSSSKMTHIRVQSTVLVKKSRTEKNDFIKFHITFVSSLQAW